MLPEQDAQHDDRCVGIAVPYPCARWATSQGMRPLSIACPTLRKHNILLLAVAAPLAGLELVNWPHVHPLGAQEPLELQVWEAPPPADATSPSGAAAAPTDHHPVRLSTPDDVVHSVAECNLPLDVAAPPLLALLSDAEVLPRLLMQGGAQHTTGDSTRWGQHMDSTWSGHTLLAAPREERWRTGAARNVPPLDESRDPHRRVRRAPEARDGAGGARDGQGGSTAPPKEKAGRRTAAYAAPRRPGLGRQAARERDRAGGTLQPTGRAMSLTQLNRSRLCVVMVSAPERPLRRAVPYWAGGRPGQCVSKMLGARTRQGFWLSTGSPCGCGGGAGATLSGCRF